jgi:hypothetical protein
MQDDMSEEREHFRWLARVTYRSQSGPVGVDHHLEELAELYDIVERGPAWSTIERIEVR